MKITKVLHPLTGLAALVSLSCSAEAPGSSPAPIEQRQSAVSGQGWRPLGPYGVLQTDGSFFTGTTMDVENPPGTGIYRLATLENGLFQWNGASWVSLVSNLQPVDNPPLGTEGLGASTIATRPGDTNTIVFGTAADQHGPSADWGSGIWLGTFDGVIWGWTQVLSPSLSGDVRKIRWSDANTVHAATTSGYWISRSGGITGSWTQVSAAASTDLVIQPNNPNIVYLARSSAGLVKVSWSLVPFNGLWARAERTIVARPTCVAHLAMSAAQPNVVYYMPANSDCDTYSLYKVSNDSPHLFPNCSGAPRGGCFPSSLLGNQAPWNGAIAVNPTNPDLLLVGSIAIYESWNATTNMAFSSVTGYHSDIHALGWAQGTFAIAGSDGGYFYARNSDLTKWFSDSNTMPMTSTTDFDLQPLSGWLFASCWDTGGYTTSNFMNPNGVSFTDNVHSDQVHVTADPGGNNPGQFWITHPNGTCLRLANGGASWTACNLPGGVLPGPVEHDHVPPVYIYALNNRLVYRSTDFGQSWLPVFTSPEAGSGFAVGSYVGALGGSYLYVVGASNLWVSQAGGTALNGTPPGLRGPISGVRTHPWTGASTTAWAWAHSWPPPSSFVQIFVTTTAGSSWTDITDDFPQTLPIWDIIADPASGSPPTVFYAATWAGVYKYTGSFPPGQRWDPWIVNLPAGGSQEAHRLRFVDQRPNGPFSVYAAILGSGLWVRDGSEIAP